MKRRVSGPALHPAEIRYLLTGEYIDRNGGANWLLPYDCDAAALLWRTHRAALLEVWRESGCTEPPFGARFDRKAPCR